LTLGRAAEETIRVQIWFYPPPLKRRASAGPELAYAEVIRQNYRQVVWRRAEWHQRLGLWLAVSSWPVWSLLEALRFSVKLGSRVRIETGKTRLQQLTEQMLLARRHLIPPSAY
jgi:hypothetical protein